MEKLQLTVNADRTAFSTSSDYIKAKLKEWLKLYDRFEVKPIVTDSVNRRRYLEGAIIPTYVKWQYGIDPREPGMGDIRRDLFKRDFAYTIVKNRRGEPVRAPESTLGRSAELVDKYCQWAVENGAPVPNPDLYKKWRDEFSMDLRFPTFHDFLFFLGIEEDAMPSEETYEALKTKTNEPEYPEYDGEPTI